MGEVNQLAEVALQHLSVLNSVSATPGQISAANAALDSLKTTLNPVSALQLCHVLLSHLFPFNPSVSPSLPAVHFAFHIIDFHILQSSQPWTSFPDDIRTAVRTLATTVICELRDGHPSLVRQKAVTLLVALALREWPQRWPDFLDNLLNVSTPVLIACHVLHDLSEQVHVFSDRIQSSRRQELRHAMALSLPQTLAYVTRAVDETISSTQASARQLEVVLDCLLSFVQWADLRALFSASVPTACITLLKRQDTRDMALKVLDTFVTRQFQSTRATNTDTNNSNNTDGDSNSASVVAVYPHIVFRDSLFPGILQFVMAQKKLLHTFAPYSLVPPAGTLPELRAAFDENVTHQSQGDDDDDEDNEEHLFCVQLFSVLAQLGATHFVPTFLFSKRSGRIQLEATHATCAAAFVDLLIVAAASPSLAMRHAVLPFFTHVLAALLKLPLQHKEGSKKPDPNSEELERFIATGFLRAAAAVLLRHTDQKLHTRFHQLDDVDDSQSAAMLAVAPRYSAAAILATRVRPDVAVPMAMHSLVRILEAKPHVTSTDVAQHSQNTGLTLRQKGLIILDNSAQNAWTFVSPFPAQHVDDWHGCAEGACLLVDAVATGVMHPHVKDPGMIRAQLVDQMRQIFDVVHQSTEPLIMSIKSATLRVLHPLYIFDDVRLGKCVEVLLALAASHKNKSNDESTLSNGISNSEQKHSSTTTTHHKQQYQKRGKILAALSAMLRKLGNSNVKSIARFWQPLCAYATEALSDTGHGSNLRALERISFMEAALASVMALDDMNLQSDGVERVLTPVLQFLSSEQVLSVLRTPRTLLDFLQRGDPQSVEQVCRAFLMLEAGMHQVVRPLSKLNTPIPLPSMLSRYIAPKAVEVSCVLIAALHGIFSTRVAAELGRTDDEMISILQPTCREASYILNFDTAENLPRGIADLTEHGSTTNPSNNTTSIGVVDEAGVKPSAGETRSAQILRSNGVTPPDERHMRLRERLRDLRRAGYEIMRAAIFSGAAESDVHLRALVTAAFDGTNVNNTGNSTDKSSSTIRKLEPLHVIFLIGRVLGPLLSYSVCEAGGAFLETAGLLGISNFLAQICDLVIDSQRGIELFGDTRVQDLTREGARHMIARSAADALVTMLPRIEGGGGDGANNANINNINNMQNSIGNVNSTKIVNAKDEQENDDNKTNKLANVHFVPRALKTSSTRNPIVKLWADISSGISDQGAARVALAASATAVDLAGESDFEIYAPLTDAALRAAVLLRAGSSPADEGAGQAAVSVLVAVFKKWPKAFEIRLAQMLHLLQQQHANTNDKKEGIEAIEKCIIECINGISSEVGMSASRVKKHRVLVRTLVERISDVEGVGKDDTITRGVVHALPEKLSAIVAGKKGKRLRADAARRNGDLDDVELTDNALDSLFGEGDPL